MVSLKLILLPPLASVDTLSCDYRYALALATTGRTQAVSGTITTPGAPHRVCGIVLEMNMSLRALPWDSMHVTTRLGVSIEGTRQ